jgi:2-dehydropantoate 2-reductase
MRLVILGLGAMGSLFAGRLSPLVDTVMVGSWPEQLAALQARQLTVIESDGRQRQVKVQATSRLEQAAPADLVLVLVKSWQTERAAGQAAKILTESGLALTLQNGLGNLERLAEAVGLERAAVGVTSEGATMIGPGLVRHAGHGRTHLATTQATAGRLAEAARLLEAAGFAVEVVENADGLLWGKVAVNAGINPLTALLQVRNGFLARHGATRAIMFEAARETAAVAQALGITLPYPDAGESVLAVAEATAGNLSSMAQDVARGAPTEIEAICGQIVAQGRARQVATPVNEMLLNLIRAVEARQRERPSGPPSPVGSADH